jgi:hypothetical protein
MHVQGSKHQAYLQDRHDWDNSTWNSIDWKGIKSGWVSFAGTLEANKNLKEYAWLAQYWTTESKDISRCNRFAQMSKVP